MSKPFNAEMLALARQARCLTQTELARKVGVGQHRLSRVEAGITQPSEAEVSRLAEVLGYKPSFFQQAFYRRAAPVSFHRKRQKLGIREWEQIYARAEIFRLNIAHMLNSVELDTKLPLPPHIDPDEYDGNVDKIAAAIRQHWMVPRGPVADTTRLVEDAGIIVVPFDFGTQLIDGFSQHATDGLPPLIFINTSQPKDRWRFTIFHELAHLVMHRLPSPKMEEQANCFAGAFLMPKNDIMPFLHNLSLKKFMEMKLHWKCAIQAIIMRCFELGAITERGKKYYLTEMSKRGYRMNEPVTLPGHIERPTTLAQLVRAHIDELAYTTDEFSTLLGMHETEVEELYLPRRQRLKLAAS